MPQRTFRLVLALAATLLGAACGGPVTPVSGGPVTGDPFFERRDLQLGLAQSDFALAPGESARTTVTVCPPALRPADSTRGVDGELLAGPWRLEVSGLPAGVSHRFVDSDQLDWRMGSAAFAPFSPPFPSPRTCGERTLELQRDATPGASAAVRASVAVVLTGPGPAAAGRMTQPLNVARIDASAGAPPPLAGTCSAGRWTDLATPAALVGPSFVFDATLAADRVLLGRASADALVFDEETDAGWRQRSLAVEGSIDSLRLRVARRAGLPVRLAAWRETDYRRPAAEQTRISVGTDDGSPLGWTTQTVAAGFESGVRGLQLAAWQGDAVVGWLALAGLELRRRDGGGNWAAIPAPADLPATGTTRELRLAVDSADDSLWLAVAVREDDGITRLRAWRRATPDADWQALPALQAGPSSGPTDLLRGLSEFALGVLRGEVVLAWTYGDAAFSSNAQLDLQVRRTTLAAADWRPVGDTGSLASDRPRYARQPLALQVAQGCGGSTFVAWNEPGSYPLGAVHAAVAGGDGLWDPFGRADLAPLPGGSGAYGSQPRLLVPSDGRPLLAVLLAPPSGGPASLVLRRFAP